MAQCFLNIILVDDNRADVELTLDALQEYNLANKIKVLQDGQEALDYIFHAGQYTDGGMLLEQPAVILLDINMPRVDGIEVLRRVRADALTKEIPVIVLTASKLDKDRIESHNLGVTDYLVKPVDFENLSRKLAQIGFRWAVLSNPPHEEKAACCGAT